MKDGGLLGPRFGAGLREHRPLKKEIRVSMFLLPIVDGVWEDVGGSPLPFQIGLDRGGGMIT